MDLYSVAHHPPVVTDRLPYTHDLAIGIACTIPALPHSLKYLRAYIPTLRKPSVEVIVVFPKVASRA